MRNVIIGTAGHVDHGKTALIKAITGVETDRLPEEKARGVSIELGFAPFTLKDGTKVGVIDVPGHERFIKNMLSGITSIDFVLFVVAADEGVMPQTEEHLNIVDLLGINKGIVALSKVDLVDEEMLELVKSDIRERFDNTSLKGCSIMPVSSVTGFGIKELVSAIEDMINGLERNIEETNNRSYLLSRLPVDRVFSKPGHGTIVTGTLIDGMIRNGDRLEIMPSKGQVRVRQIQVHEREVESAYKGQRVALNLAGLEKKDVEKGMWVASLGALDESKLLDVELKLAEGAETISNRQRLRLNIGSAEVLCRVRVISGEEILGGQRAYAQLELEELVAVVHSDRFIIRTYSPPNTVGGGRILFHSSKRLKKADPKSLKMLELLASSNVEEVVLGSIIALNKSKLVNLKCEFFPFRATEIARVLGMEIEPIQIALNKGLSNGLYVELKIDALSYYILKSDYKEAAKIMLAEVEKAFASNELIGGISRDELRTKTFPEVEVKAFASLVDKMASEGIIVFSNNLISVKSVAKQDAAQFDPVVKQIEDYFLSNLFTPPEKSEVIALVKNGKKAEDVLKYLVKEGKLVRVGPDMFFHAEAIKKAFELVKTMGSHAQGFTLAQFRDAISASRKFAVMLLDYFDGQRKTKRDGDFRKYIGD